MAVNFAKAEFIRSAANREGFLRDSLPQFAFAGRSNVGKSSVINRLVNRKNLLERPRRSTTSLLTRRLIW